MKYEDKPVTFCEDLNKFIMTFISTTADAIQTIQGSSGLMIMSVAIGTKLWDELNMSARCTIPKAETREEKINCFMNVLKNSGAIGDYSFKEERGHLEIEVKDCFFAPASDKQVEQRLKQPLCPIGGMIVAGLHKAAHILATLEKADHSSQNGVSKLTFSLY